MKKVLVVILLILFPINCLALEIEIDSKCAVLYDRNIDKILYSKNEDDITLIASLTKIMTTIVTLENIKDLNEIIVVEENDLLDLDGYSIEDLKVGDSISYKDLLYSTIISSAADSAQTLSNHVFNTHDEFIKKMNELAKKIGMKSTHFSNPIGKDYDNYSTCNDMYKLLDYALDNENFKNIYTTLNYKMDYNDKELKNRINELVTKKKFENDNNIRFLGTKSGFTTPSGLSLSSLTKLDNEEIILITLNSMNNKENNQNVQDQLKILNYFYENFSNRIVLSKDRLIDNIIYKKNNKNYKYEIRSDKDISYYLDNKLNLDYLKIYYDGVLELDNSFKNGDELGKINIYLDDEFLTSEEVYFDKKYIIKEKQDYTKLAILISILIISALFMKLTAKKKK